MPQPTTPPPVLSGPGSAIVQLGLFKQASSVEAHWRKVSVRLPANAQGFKRYEDKVDVRGNQLYRLSLAGYQSLEAAKAACGQLKKVGIDCYARTP